VAFSVPNCSLRFPGRLRSAYRSVVVDRVSSYGIHGEINSDRILWLGPFRPIPKGATLNLAPETAVITFEQSEELLRERRSQVKQRQLW